MVVIFHTVPISDFKEWLHKRPQIEKEFLRELDLAFHAEFNRKVVLNDLYNNFREIPQKEIFFLVGLEDDHLVSFLCWFVIPVDQVSHLLGQYRVITKTSKYRYVFISSLFVVSSQRLKGHGRELLLDLEKLLLDNFPREEQKRYWLTLRVFKDNFKALSLYLKFGYEFFDFTNQDYLMVKKLTKSSILKC